MICFVQADCTPAGALLFGQLPEQEGLQVEDACQAFRMVYRFYMQMCLTGLHDHVQVS